MTRGRNPSSIVLALLHVRVVAGAYHRLVGEHGQEVLACQCMGKSLKPGYSEETGYCDFHFLHSNAKDDRPWCSTKHGCGFVQEKTEQTSWEYCDKRGVERRRARDGKLYDASEFRKFYGKEDAWVAAAKYVETRLARNGRAYSAHEFRDYYIDALGEQGWLTEWAAAKEERRQADDGKFYTFEEFVEFFGLSESWRKWELAKSNDGMRAEL
eukprot:TRINITY_DN82622_c0_g1_i1.p1 TRINITY_DN82622_c0_g1~~TRINITY_DN82622_c0_g1_i1.p1  ORF type:complete len:221 (+),score=52.41 TRINITY_DN82622_c0_g1_i1:30-665(+)